MGRPRKITNSVVRKLEQAFEDGLNVTEACYSSVISRDTYYRRLQTDKAFSDKMSKSQAFLVSKAKSVVAKAVKRGDLGASKWLLDRELKKQEQRADEPNEAEQMSVEEAEHIENGIRLYMETRIEAVIRSSTSEQPSSNLLSSKQIKAYQSLDTHEALVFAVDFFKKHPEAIDGDEDARLLGLQLLASADELVGATAGLS